MAYHRGYRQDQLNLLMIYILSQGVDILRQRQVRRQRRQRRQRQLPSGPGLARQLPLEKLQLVIRPELRSFEATILFWLFLTLLKLIQFFALSLKLKIT